MTACRAALVQADIYGAAQGSTVSPQEIQTRLALARCIRAHGVPNFPDPNPTTGDVSPPPGLTKTSPSILAALAACPSSSQGSRHHGAFEWRRQRGVVTTRCQVVSPRRHRCCRTTRTTVRPAGRRACDMFRRSPAHPPRQSRTTRVVRPSRRRRRGPWVRHVGRVRPAAAVRAQPGVAQLSTTTSPSSPSSSTSSNGPASALAHAECMRSHGVPDFPDPGPIQIDVSAHPDLDPNSPAFVAAAKACVSLEPAGPAGNGVTPQLQAAALAYSACMRTHGFPKFADPVFDSQR